MKRLLWPKLLAAALSGMVLPSTAADWRQFRGNDGNPVADTPLPTTWSEQENTAWKADLPGRGVSSPIVVGDRVIVTASSGARQDRLHVLAFDAKTGRRLWHRQFWATGRTLSHPTSANAAPTPTSDGESIFAFFSSNDLICLDLDGNLKWLRGLTHDYPTAANDVGMAASPVVVGDTVVVQVECKGDSFAGGIDKTTGEPRWKIPRAVEMNWTSPAVLHGPTGDLVLLQSTDRLTAHDPRTGDAVWTYEAPCDAIPSPLAVDDLVIVAAANGLTAFKRPAAGATPEPLWQDKKLGPGPGSPLVHRNRVYTVSRGNVLNCAALDTGAELWRLRLKGPFWATGVAAGDHLYFVNQDGLAQVVKPEETEGTIVAEIPFGESVLGSPAVADGAMYIRSDGHLWKIAAGG